jgi:peptidoglycan hydrolase-like protein with peptidoglycan-binding domain
MSIKSGNQVREWQKGLSEAGYDVGNVDGTWSEATSAATKQFQLDQGFPADGKVGKACWDRLQEVLAGAENPPPPAAGKSPTPFWKHPLFWAAASGAVLVGFAAMKDKE